MRGHSNMLSLSIMRGQHRNLHLCLFTTFVHFPLCCLHNPNLYLCRILFSCNCPYFLFPCYSKQSTIPLVVRYTSTRIRLSRQVSKPSAKRADLACLFDLFDTQLLVFSQTLCRLGGSSASPEQPHYPYHDRYFFESLLCRPHHYRLQPLDLPTMLSL